MLALSLAEIAEACGGRLEGGDPRARIERVCTDTRALRPGDLFLALRGDIFDGDAFAADALRAGAAAVVVRESAAAGLSGHGTRIVVEDGRGALAALATAVRRRSGVKLVAVTGSAGKTSTKDILAALLRPVASVVATEANLNNEIGVPQTLLQVDEGTEIVVVEMAMRGAGQIRELARIALPDVGVITNIAPVHLELMGTVEDVAAAKAELMEELREGTAVVPAEESLLDRHLGRFRGRVVTFGGPRADVQLVAAEQRGQSTHVLVDAFGQRGTLDLGFTGEHYVTDAMAALAAFLELGYHLDEAREGAARVSFSAMRGAVSELPGGGLLLNDAYNANPLATVAAIDHLVSIAAGRPAVAVLGDMAELGAAAAALHRGVGQHCTAAGVRLVAVGRLARDYLTGAPGEVWFASVDECLEALPVVAPAGSAVLVKASRVARFERIAEALERGRRPGPEERHDA